MSKNLIKQPFGAMMVVRNGNGQVTGTKRDYKKASIDAAIVATIAAMSVLVAFGYPPEAEVFYATFLAFVFAFFTSLARKLDIEYER